MQKCIKKQLLQMIAYLNRMLILFLFLNPVTYNYILRLTTISSIKIFHIEAVTTMHDLLSILLH